MKRLRDIWLKASVKSDKGDAHSYLEIYDLLLSRYADKKISLLEIGVKDGGSLLMWKDYFLPGSIIHGVENETVKTALNGVAVFFGNAYSDEMVNTVGSYDIIIDDGSHKLPDIKFFIRHYLCKVKNGGLLVVEDIQPGVNTKELFDVLPKENRPFAYLVDCRHAKGRSDDMLFVVAK